MSGNTKKLLIPFGEEGTLCFKNKIKSLSSHWKQLIIGFQTINVETPFLNMRKPTQGGSFFKIIQRVKGEVRIQTRDTVPDTLP